MDHTSKLLQQIEISEEANQVLSECAQTALSAKLISFEPMLTIQPYIFDQQLKGINYKKQTIELDADIDKLKKVMELEGEQIEALEQFLEEAKNSRVSEKELANTKTKLENSIKQYTKEMNNCGTIGLDLVESVINMAEKLKTTK